MVISKASIDVASLMANRRLLQSRGDANEKAPFLASFLYKQGATNMQQWESLEVLKGLRRHELMYVEVRPWRDL